MAATAHTASLINQRLILMKVENIHLVRVPNTAHNLTLLKTQLEAMIGRIVGEAQVPVQGRGQSVENFRRTFSEINQERGCFKLLAFYAMIASDENGKEYIQVTGDLEVVDGRYGRMVKEFIATHAINAWRVAARLLSSDIESQQVNSLIALDFAPQV